MGLLGAVNDLVSNTFQNMETECLQKRPSTAVRCGEGPHQGVPRELRGCGGHGGTGTCLPCWGGGGAGRCGFLQVPRTCVYGR